MEFKGRDILVIDNMGERTEWIRKPETDDVEGERIETLRRAMNEACFMMEERKTLQAHQLLRDILQWDSKNAEKEPS